MPSRKEIQWSQLRVGALVVVAMAILVGLILLMSGSSGGPFARKLTLRCYFENAGGLKDGAPVALEGVTIGNVIHIRVVPERNPTPVEVTLRVSHDSVRFLHTDSTALIDKAGVLGDSFVDIHSTHATGPPPANNAELKAASTASIQDLINSSGGSITEIQSMMRKVGVLLDTLNSRRGTMGELINDPEEAHKIAQLTTDLENITGAINSNKGTLGKLINDDSLYDRANSAVDRLNKVAIALDEGKGSAGKLLKDDKLYDNLNAVAANANQLVAEINAGKGALGVLAKDPAFAQKLDDAVSRLDSILKGMDEGKGTLGQMVVNRGLYDHADQAMDQAQQLLKDLRADPKKYLVIHMKVF